MATKLRRFIPSYGGKRSIAAKYPKPVHAQIIEPFAGGAGYSLEYPDHPVHLMDLDERVCGVWDYLIHATEADILSIPVDIQDVSEIPPRRHGDEVRWLVGWWMSPAAASGPATRSYTWGKQHAGRSDVWGEKCRDRLAQQVHAIRHWTVEQGSYESLDIDRLATWFVDPPYEVKGKHYHHSTLDYKALAIWCRSLNGQVIVCENEGADWLPFTKLCDFVSGQKPIRGPGNGGGKRTVEMIWTS